MQFATERVKIVYFLFIMHGTFRINRALLLR